MLNLNESAFKDEISSGIAVVDFWAVWCAPCRMFAPAFEKMSENIKEAKFAKVNTDDNHSLTESLNIGGIPTIIVFKDGKEVKRWEGAVKEKDVKSVVDKLNETT